MMTIDLFSSFTVVSCFQPVALDMLCFSKILLFSLQKNRNKDIQLFCFFVCLLCSCCSLSFTRSLSVQKSSSNEVFSFWRQGRWELDVELDDEVTFLCWVGGHRHTFSRDNFLVARPATAKIV